MDWKQFFVKVGKGALSGVVAIAGGLMAAGIPMDKHAAIAAGGAILSAAVHGAWNVVDQYLAGWKA